MEIIEIMARLAIKFFLSTIMAAAYLSIPMIVAMSNVETNRLVSEENGLDDLLPVALVVGIVMTISIIFGLGLLAFIGIAIFLDDALTGGKIFISLYGVIINVKKHISIRRIK